MSLGKDDKLNDANPISTKSEQGHVMIAEPRLYETSKSRKTINQTALHTSSMKRVHISLQYDFTEAREHWQWFKNSYVKHLLTLIVR